MMTLVVVLALGACHSQKSIVIPDSIEAYTSVDTIPSAREILTQTLEKVKGIHVARYDFNDRRFATPDDSLFMIENKSVILECENPSDTTGNSYYVRYGTDGAFRGAFDGRFKWSMSDDYVEKNAVRHYDVVMYLWPPFFNHVKNLCEYLLSTDSNSSLDVKDHGDEWEIDAVIDSFNQVVFSGRPMEGLAIGTPSYFGLRVDKTTRMPSWISYRINYPQTRIEESVSNVDVNPFQAETFDIEAYIPPLELVDSDEARSRRRKKVSELKPDVLSKPLPTDTLQLSAGGTVSLQQNRGKVRVVLFTGSYCGVCPHAYPTFNRILRDYPADKLEVFGVMYDPGASPEAVENYRRTKGLEIPLALNNRHFYEHFLPSGLAPATLIVGPDDKVVMWNVGFNANEPERTEKLIRQGIDKAMNGDY